MSRKGISDLQLADKKWCTSIVFYQAGVQNDEWVVEAFGSSQKHRQVVSVRMLSVSVGD